MKKVFLLIGAFLGFGMLPMLMGPTGGFPYYPQFGAVGVGAVAPASGMTVTSARGVTINGGGGLGVGTSPGGGNTILSTGNITTNGQFVSNATGGGQLQVIAVGAGGGQQSLLQLFTDNNAYLDGGISGTPVGGKVIIRTGASTLVSETLSTSGTTFGATGLSAMGAGTINAQGVYVNGTAVATGTVRTAGVGWTISSGCTTTPATTPVFYQNGQVVTIRFTGTTSCTLSGTPACVVFSGTMPPGTTPATSNVFAGVVQSGSVSVAGQINVLFSGAIQACVNSGTLAAGTVGLAGNPTITYTTD